MTVDGEHPEHEMSHQESPPAVGDDGVVAEVDKEATEGSVELQKEEEEHHRGKGVSTLDYMITLMGYAIGIGNLWRFPYLVGKWGGGSFVLAYLVCLVLVATPMYLVELHWGQYTRMNTIECFKTMHPRWIGIAVTGALMVTFISMYYNLLLAYACVYLIGSFYNPLPWTTDALGDTGNMSASEYYWRNTVLNEYPGEQVLANDLDGAGPLQWRLVIGLLCVWIIVYLALFKGIEASAKVSYVTVGLPVVCLLVMLIRAVTLEGAGDGIEFYIGKFDGDKLWDGEMWATACGQILFSLSPGMGTAVTLSSYSRPSEDVYRVNYLVTICNSAFSITGGFAVFSILGFMAHRSCEPDPTADSCVSVDVLAQRGGAGLAFMTLAEGVSQFGDGSNVFSFLFFLMLLTLGLDSTFAWIETLNTYVYDYSRKVTGTALRKELVAAVTAIFFFLTGVQAFFWSHERIS
ncbi:Sodium-dependent serotonin transporter [Diplonema papillatum]|nr:Sodium-dependent serotonin transporter [Diplonema papillatum]